MELQDRTGACPRAARNEGGAEGAAAVAASAVIGAALWSDHDPYTDEAFSIRGRGTSGCATPVPPCGCPSTRCSPSPGTTRCGVCCGGLARHRVLRGRQPRRAQVSRPGSVRCAAKSPVAQVGQMRKAAHPSAAPAMIRRGAAASAGGDLNPSCGAVAGRDPSLRARSPLGTTRMRRRGHGRIVSDINSHR